MSATTAAKPKTGTMPKGIYDAQLTGVSTTRRREDGSWVLRILARTTRLERDAVIWQGLAHQGDDPYALDDKQLASLRRFAERVGIRSAQTAEEIVEDLLAMAEAGEVVQVRVAHTPVGQQSTLFKEGIQLPAVAEPSEQDAQAAQGAHEKFLAGLAEARVGLAHAAEGAYLLRSTEGWKALGCENVTEYLAAPEITMSRTEFYRLAEIWERYVLNGGVPVAELQGVGPTKLEVPLPALEAGVVSAVQALADATSMPRADLRTHYQGLLGNDDEQPDEPRQRHDDDDQGQQSTVDEQVSTAQAETIDVQAAEIERLREENEHLKGEKVGEINAILATNEAAHRVIEVLRRVLDEIGDPKQKRMGKQLRQAVVEALELADEHGLGADA